MTIIMRSALVYHGHNPAPEVHSVVIDARHGRQIVTWREVMEHRRQRQRLIIARKMACRVERVYRICVAHYGSRLMGGWQAMADRPGESHWIDRDRRWIQRSLMTAFPLTLFDDWGEWKEQFARTFRRGTRCRHPRGAAFVWWDGHGETLRRAA